MQLHAVDGLLTTLTFCTVSGKNRRIFGCGDTSGPRFSSSTLTCEVSPGSSIDGTLMKRAARSESVAIEVTSLALLLLVTASTSVAGPSASTVDVTMAGDAGEVNCTATSSGSAPGASVPLYWHSPTWPTLLQVQPLAKGSRVIAFCRELSSVTRKPALATGCGPLLRKVIR